MPRSIESRVPGEEEKNEGEGWLSRATKVMVIVGTGLLPLSLENGSDSEVHPEREKTPPVLAVERFKTGDKEIEIERRNMTFQKCQEFWANEMADVKGLIEKEECDIPELAERYKSQRRRIFDKYNKVPKVQINVNYAPEGYSGAAGSMLDGDEPSVMFFGPALRDIYIQIKNSGSKTWKEEFKSFCLIGVLHEFDHLESGNIGKKGEKINPNDQLEREKNAQALTCENVVRPMVEKGLPIDISHKKYYASWVKSGRDVNSPVWDKEIKGYYGNLYAK